MFALILALFAYLGPVDIHIVDGPVVATEYHDGQVVQHAAGAKATACIDGKAHIEGTAAALSDLTNLAHELLHLADCRDNGIYDGSPDPTHGEEVSGDPLHSWVWWGLRNPESAVRIIEGMGR